MVTHNVKSYAARESIYSTREEYPLLGARRGVTSCSARGNSLQEEDGVADFSEADRGAMEAREDFRCMSVELVYRHHVMPREHLHIPKEHSQIRQNTLTS